MDSFISWVGGKKLLRKEICRLFPESDYNKYVEVFGGAGWVLFHKEKHAELEIYNDINSNLVNLYKCVKYHPNAMQEELDYILNSREFFNNFKELYKSTALTDIQRATMYFYMIKTSYASKITSFGAKARDVTNVEYLKTIKERLRTVIIENKSYEALIKQYDRPTTLFYCDPPYLGSESYYEIGNMVFDQAQHINLRDILANIQGKCIISYNDHDLIRELYKNFNIHEVQRQNNMGIRYDTNKTFKELIITNY